MDNQPAPGEAELLAQNIVIAKKLARKFCSSELHCEWEDIYSDAALGILDAIRRYNPEHGVPLYAYAFIRAKGAAIDGIRKRRYGSRMYPAYAPDSLSKILDAAESHEDREGPVLREPPTTESGFNAVEAKMVVSEALKRLTPKQLKVIRWHYFDNRNLKDIGEELGVNESRVCQIVQNALHKMHGTIEV